MLNFTYVSVVAKSAEKNKYGKVPGLWEQLPEAAPHLLHKKEWESVVIWCQRKRWLWVLGNFCMRSGFPR